MQYVLKRVTLFAHKDGPREFCDYFTDAMVGGYPVLGSLGVAQRFETKGGARVARENILVKTNGF